MILTEHSVPYTFMDIRFTEWRGFRLPYYWSIKKWLFHASHIFTRTQASAMALRKLGLSNVSFAGNTRITQINATLAMISPYSMVDKGAAFAYRVVCGSTDGADEIKISRMTQLTSDIQWVIVPHEVTQDRIDEIRKLFPKALLTSEQPKPDSPVIIHDIFGELLSIYATAQVCYIGGGFTTGVHNILEAGLQAKPLIFGPRHGGAPEAREWMDAGYADVFKTAEEGLTKLNHLLRLTIPGEFVASYIDCHSSSVSKVGNHLLQSTPTLKMHRDSPRGS